MTILGVIVIVLQVVLVSSQVCPTWFIRQENKCGCGQQINTILTVLEYDKQRWRILPNLQQWYRFEHFGACPYNTKRRVSKFCDVPSDASKLGEEIAWSSQSHRATRHCQPRLGPAVFSYYKECKECMPQPLGWLLFFVRLTVPLTLICVIVIVFQTNVASPVLFWLLRYYKNSVV